MQLDFSESLYEVFHASENSPWPVALDEPIGGPSFNVTIDVSR